MKSACILTLNFSVSRSVYRSPHHGILLQNPKWTEKAGYQGPSSHSEEPGSFQPPPPRENHKGANHSCASQPFSKVAAQSPADHLPASAQRTSRSLRAGAKKDPNFNLRKIVSRESVVRAHGAVLTCTQGHSASLSLGGGRRLQSQLSILRTSSRLGQILSPHPHPGWFSTGIFP